MTQQQAIAFAERNRDAFSRFDPHAVTALYGLPCIYSQEAVPAVFSDQDALLDNNTRLVEFYRQDGLENVGFADLKVHSFGERHALVDVQWTLTRHEKPPVIFRTAYNLRCFDGDWKIWAITVYEERAAFAHETAQAH